MLASLGRSSALDTKMSGRDAEKGIPSWARSHPLTDDRVASARREAAKTGVLAGKAARNRDAFLNALAGQIYEDDHKQGVVEGQPFRHSDLRLQFKSVEGRWGKRGYG